MSAKDLHDWDEPAVLGQLELWFSALDVLEPYPPTRIPVPKQDEQVLQDDWDFGFSLKSQDVII